MCLQEYYNPPSISNAWAVTGNHSQGEYRRYATFGSDAVAVAKAQMAVREEGADISLTDLLQELSDLSLRVGWWRMALPESSEPMVWIQFVVLKLLGLGLTVAAVSQGSSFWYDLLKKIVSPSKGGGGSSSEEAKG